MIGGGVIGVSAAYYLAKKGLSVALVEKGRVGGEQSSRNWGWCRQQGRDARGNAADPRSLRLWDDMQDEIGADVGFRRTGVLYVTNDPDELASWEAWAQGRARDAGPLADADAGEVAARACRAVTDSMGRRPAHAERRPRRAVDGRAGAGDGRAQAWA